MRYAFAVIVGMTIRRQLAALLSWGRFHGLEKQLLRVARITMNQPAMNSGLRPDGFLIKTESLLSAHKAQPTRPAPR